MESKTQRPIDGLNVPTSVIANIFDIPLEGTEK